MFPGMCLLIFGFLLYTSLTTVLNRYTVYHTLLFMIHKTYVENHMMMLLTVESVKHCCIHHTHTCLIGLMINSNQPKHAAIHFFITVYYITILRC